MGLERRAAAVWFTGLTLLIGSCLLALALGAFDPDTSLSPRNVGMLQNDCRAYLRHDEVPPDWCLAALGLTPTPDR